MNAWLPFAHAWLLDLVVLTTVLLTAAVLLRIVLRDARSRVLLAWCTWLGIAAAALVTLLPGWPRYELRALSQSMSRKQPIAVITLIEPDLPVADDGDVPVDSSAVRPIDTPKPPSPIAPWRDLPILAWLAAALAGLAWIALGAWQARRLLRRSQPAPQWMHAELAQLCQSAVGNAIRGVPSFNEQCLADVRTSTKLTSPVALRARKPAILLPYDSADPSNTKVVRAALAHEWAHIRHGDLWLLALERLLLPLLALHPLFWWLRRSTQIDQELLADAAAAGDKPVEYAEALVAWAKNSAPPPASLAALAFWERPSNLTRRVHMVLHQPRPVASRFNRLLSFAVLAFVLALVGGLSLVTLQPLAAEDEPAKPASVVEHPIGPLPTSAPATPASQTIELSCIVLELEPAELAKVLSGGEHPPLPSPAVELGIQHAEEWSESLKKLEANPGVRVVSRPRIRTLNNLSAGLEIVVDTVKVEGRDEMRSLKVELQPELLPKIGNDQQLLLWIAFERTLTGDRTGDSGKSVTPVKRKVQTKVAVPLGKVVVVADPSNRSPAGKSLRPVLLVIHPRLVAQWEEARIATPEEVDAASRRDAAAIRHSLLRLQREIAALLEQTSRGGVSTFVPDTQAAGAAAPARTAKRSNAPQFIPVGGDPEKALAQLQLRMKELKIDGVTIGVDSKSGSLIVSGPEQQIAEVRKLLFEIERTAAASSQQQLQQKLLELDLREAEIGLQAAKAEHEQMAEVRRQSPSAVSNSELRQSQLKVELAQVQLERMKVRLEAARAVNPPATPAAPRR